jgi:hypothetical protein
MPMDPNEIFPFLRATSNLDLLRQVQQAVNARVEEVQTAQVGGPGGQLMQPHVQPTDEYNPGVIAGQPLVGPDPQGRSGTDVKTQAVLQQRLQEAQTATGRGPGPQPVAVDVGPATDQQREQARQTAQREQERTAQENERTARAGAARPKGDNKAEAAPPEEKPQGDKPAAKEEPSGGKARGGKGARERAG